MSSTTSPNATGVQTAGCPKCGFSGDIRPDAWCPQCGYYPKLGRCVDLGPEALRQEDAPLEPLSIPGWFWVLVAGSVGIAGMSLFARFNVPDDGPRTIWSLGQFLIGLAVLLAAHLRAYVAASFREAEFTPLDMVLRPFRTWSATFDNLPEGNMRVRLAAWGITAAFCAMFLVGGMSYAKIDAMIVEYLPDPPTETTVAAVMEAEPVAEKQQMTCVVIGYTRSVAGATRSLLVADMLDGQPRRFVAKVMDEGIDESVLNYVNAMIPRLGIPRGRVACPISAYWLEPEIVVVVEYDGLDEQEKLVGASIVSIVTAEEEDEVDEVAGEAEGTMPETDSAPTAQEENDRSAPANDDQATSSSSSSSSSS